MKYRRSLLRPLVAAACALLALSACSDSGSSGSFEFSSATKLGSLIPAHDRKPAQSVSGTLLDGGKTSLAAMSGKVGVVNFWASWCGPCQVETPQLGLYYRKVKDKGVDFLGVDTKDDKGSAKSFVANNDISYPILYDQQGKAQLRLGNIPGNLPFTVLLDKQGRVAAVYLARLSPKDLDKPIDTLLAEH